VPSGKEERIVLDGLIDWSGEECEENLKAVIHQASFCGVRTGVFAILVFYFQT
jgi:hypothetical protein